MALETRNITSTYDEDNGRLTETWMVWDTAGVATTNVADVLATLRAGSTPARITTGLSPRKPYAGTWATTTIRDTLRLRDYSIRMLQAGTGWAAELTASWGTKYVRRTDRTPNPVSLPVARSISPGQRQMNVYRDILGSAAFPTGTTLQSAADIGGTKLDEGGNPVVIMVPQITVTLTSLIDSYQTDITAYDLAFSTHGLTLNNAAFLGFPAYHCLLTSVDFTHMEEEWFNARIQFLYDAYQFFEQVPKRDSDNKLLLDSNGQCADVRWKRGNVESTNWNASTLLPTGTWTYSRLYQAEFGVSP
jgi:hypothetical protein